MVILAILTSAGNTDFEVLLLFLVSYVRDGNEEDLVSLSIYLYLIRVRFHFMSNSFEVAYFQGVHIFYFLKP